MTVELMKDCLTLLWHEVQGCFWESGDAGVCIEGLQTKKP